MLRKFKIAIDGKQYLVEMEEIGGVQQPNQTIIQAQNTPESIVEESIAAVPKPVVTDTAGADALCAPMPGAILKILVDVNEPVRKNQPVMILEAMKMENEIVAPNDGTVTGIHVAQGDVVNPGDSLITIS